MKKISITAVAAILLATSTISCESASASKGSATSLDTVSCLLGEMNGYAVARSPIASDSTFDKAAFLKGFEFMMNADTSDVSYLDGLAFGMQMSRALRSIKDQQGIELDYYLVAKEFRKAFMADSAIDPSMLQMELSTRMRQLEREAKEKDPKAIANKKAGEVFITKALKEDTLLKKTESGLVYKVLKEGDGNLFRTTDRILIKYKGSHIDGQVFDERQEPLESSPMGFVPGFKEALLLMSPGAKFLVYIPGDLAYGVDGRGNAIGPNETLVFEIETVGVAKDSKK